VGTSKRRCDLDVGTDQGVPLLGHQLRSAPCQGLPAQATASKLRICVYRGKRQRRSPMGTESKEPRRETGSSRPCFRCARRRRAWEVQSWLERELDESQKNCSNWAYCLPCGKVLRKKGQRNIENLDIVLSSSRGQSSFRASCVMARLYEPTRCRPYRRIRSYSVPITIYPKIL
jgi:hypothetical protein